MIEAGVYRGRCTGVRDIRWGYSAAGNEQIGVLFEITDGEYAGQRLVFYASVATPDARAFARQALMSAGWDGKSWDAMFGLGSVPCRLVVELEQNERGRTVPRLKYVNREVAVSFKNQMQRGDVVSLTKRLDALDAADASNGGPGEPPPGMFDDGF